VSMKSGQGQGSNDREFDLRMITCSFDDALDTISKGPFVDLQQSIYFNGDTSPGPSPSAGLILPELAPSSVDNSFWIAYEMQTESGSLPNGRIRLEYYEMDSGNWATTFGTTFKSPPGLTPFVRRRPNISSYPPTSTSQGEQMVSITFNKRNPDPLAADQTANVVYKEVAWQNGSNNHHLFVVTGWMNSTGYQDGKPTVIRGRDYPFIRRCFVDRLDTSVPKCDIISYDDITGVYSSRDSVPAPPGTIGRPAADYHFENGAASPDYIPLTWERKDIQADPLKIWLGVE